MKKATRQEMLDWILDCPWIEDPEDIEGLSDERLARGIERHYQGGMAQFVRDGVAQ